MFINLFYKIKFVRWRKFVLPYTSKCNKIFRPKSKCFYIIMNWVNKLYRNSHSYHLKGSKPLYYRKCWIQLCIPAMHVTSLFSLIVSALYDERTALVKSDNVASKHVWKAVKGAYCWWKSGYRNLWSYVTFLLDMWSVLLLFFLRHAWTDVVAQASWYFRTVLRSIRCLVSLSRFQSSACCAVHVAWVCFQ